MNTFEPDTRMVVMTDKNTGNSTTSVAKNILAFHGVRYLVTDVKKAVDFYTQRLGFTLEQEAFPAFATVSFDSLKILISGPSASGSRPLPNGEPQGAGGSNRVVLRVKDLPAVIEGLRGDGAVFRNAMETGPGGIQIQVLDPDGNPIELFEPARQ